MPEIQLAERKIHYFEHLSPGTSIPPLLLIHGAGGQHIHWPPQLRRMPSVTVYAPDLPGHGESSGPGRSTIAAYAADMLALLDALAVKRAVVAGHSMGGAIAQQMALEAPERVAGLILIATGARLRVAPQILENALHHPDAVADFVTTYAYGPTADEQIKRMGQQALLDIPPEVLLGDYMACDAFNCIGRVEEIRTPTLVIGGKEDKMTPPRYSEFLVVHIPGAEQRFIEQAGHMIPIEFPDELARVVKGWLESRESDLTKPSL